MKKILLNTVFSVAIAAILTPSATHAFSDVATGSKYYADVQYLIENGIIRDNNGLFQPGQNILFRDYARWIMKASGFNPAEFTPRNEIHFSDLDDEDSDVPYIHQLIDFNFLSYNYATLSIEPNRQISRLTGLDLLFKVEGVPVPRVFDKSTYPFADIYPSSPFAHILDKAGKIGLIGEDRALPFFKLTRGQAARWLRVFDEQAANENVTVIINSTDGTGIDNEKFDIFVDAWNRVNQTFIGRDEVDQNELMYAAIQGFVKELGDQYSVFSRPDEETVVSTLDNEIEGIGAVITIKDGKLTVISPLKDSPAEKSGLKPYDVITHIDGEATLELTLNESVALIKGPAGTSVILTIDRGGTKLTLTIERAKITLEPVILEFTDDNIAIVTINDFGVSAVEGFRTAAEEIVKRGSVGLVIDLRNNPGGYLDAAVDIAGYFVEKGKTVALLDYPAYQLEHASNGPATLINLRTAVLVNDGSASASEILAGTLQDYGLATIIGEQTYGKGSVQELTRYIDGSSLKVTVAAWLTPKANSIEHKGITPDIVVPLTEEDWEANRDPQFDRALQEVRR